MKIGSIVQVRSFAEYVVRVPVDGDSGYIPASSLGIGSYVSIKSAQGSVIGVISDILHNVKEDLLPYLPQEKQEVFVPYMADFRSSYVVVSGIGCMSTSLPSHTIAFTPAINDIVELMQPADIKAFHQTGDGKMSFGYYKKLTQSTSPAVASSAIDRASEAMPECSGMLKALKKYTENRYEAGRRR